MRQRWDRRHRPWDRRRPWEHHGVAGLHGIATAHGAAGTHNTKQPGFLRPPLLATSLAAFPNHSPDLIHLFAWTTWRRFAAEVFTRLGGQGTQTKARKRGAHSKRCAQGTICDLPFRGASSESRETGSPFGARRLTTTDDGHRDPPANVKSNKEYLRKRPPPCTRGSCGYPGCALAHTQDFIPRRLMCSIWVALCGESSTRSVVWS